MKNLNRIILRIVVMLTILVFAGCKKFVEVDMPIDKNTSQAVYNNIGSAAAVLNGIYADMARVGRTTPFSGERSISVTTGLTSDELALQEGNITLYQNAYDSNDPTDVWNLIYGDYLFRVNSFLNGVEVSEKLSEDSKNILIGEGKFLRAFLFFYLCNIYGDVPLVTTTDPNVNSNIARSTENDVYNQIVRDLQDAQNKLKANFLGPDLSGASSLRVRPTKAAASGLLARVYLYTGNWQGAELEASKVIDDNRFQLLSDLNEVFLSNSRESIWQIQTQLTNVNNLPNTPDGIYFIPISNGIPKVFLSSELLTAFEANDKRKASWTKSITSGTDNFVIPYKYKAGPESTVQTEFVTALRLSEQYLIRAEARVMQAKLTGPNSAQSDLNNIRHRAGLENTTANSEVELKKAILRERQLELFTEWGHRWFDLRRTDNIDIVMSKVCPDKGGTWLTHKSIFPLPVDEFRLNTALRGHQNPGYPEPTYLY